MNNINAIYMAFYPFRIMSGNVTQSFSNITKNRPNYDVIFNGFRKVVALLLTPIHNSEHIHFSRII